VHDSVYRTVLLTGLHRHLPIHRRPLSSGVYSLFSGTQAQVMNVPPLQPRPVPPRPHWTELVSREERVARREKFRKIGWLPPNHKPKTKIVIATAKRLLEKYVIRGCRLCLRGVTVRTADGVLSGIGVMPTAWGGGPRNRHARASSSSF
jgi:hypothetical protein